MWLGLDLSFDPLLPEIESSHRYHHQMDFSTQESQSRMKRRRTFLVPPVSIAPSTVASRKVKDTPIKSGDRCAESVAVCLVGAARSFPSPIIQAAFVENFLKQLGTNVILFGLFKLTDTEKYSREIQFRRHVNDFRNVSAALASPTLLPWLRHGEAIILNGSGIPVADVRHFPGVHSEIVHTHCRYLEVATANPTHTVLSGRPRQVIEIAKVIVIKK